MIAPNKMMIQGITPIVPFSNKKMIDADQLHELIDEIRISMPPEIKRAQEMEAQKKAIQDMGKTVTGECYQKKSGFMDSIKEFFS